MFALCTPGTLHKLSSMSSWESRKKRWKKLSPPLFQPALFQKGTTPPDKLAAANFFEKEKKASSKLLLAGRLTAYKLHKTYPIFATCPPNLHCSIAFGTGPNWAVNKKCLVRVYIGYIVDAKNYPVMWEVIGKYIKLGGFKHFLYSPLFGEDFQFD